MPVLTHKSVSYVKSAFRIAGFVVLAGSFRFRIALPLACTLLVWAEVLGIIEEMFA